VNGKQSRLAEFFTVISMVCEILAAKARKSWDSMQGGFATPRSEEHGVQRRENARKNSFLEYFLAQS
jgi:hypothetical protein